MYWKYQWKGDIYFEVPGSSLLIICVVSLPRCVLCCWATERTPPSWTVTIKAPLSWLPPHSSRNALHVCSLHDQSYIPNALICESIILSDISSSYLNGPKRLAWHPLTNRKLQLPKMPCCAEPSSYLSCLMLDTWLWLVRLFRSGQKHELARFVWFPGYRVTSYNVNCNY